MSQLAAGQQRTKKLQEELERAQQISSSSTQPFSLLASQLEQKDALIDELRAAKETAEADVALARVRITGRPDAPHGLTSGAFRERQRRRVQLLIALAQERRILLMDEVTTDLDIVARHALLEFLREESASRGATVLYATHIFDSLDTWATHLMYVAMA